MHEIICPNCKKEFKIDDAGYADIAKQVRDSEFSEQLKERLYLADREKQGAVELVKEKVAREMQALATEKDALIQALQAKLDAGETARQLAVSEALKEVERERDELANKLRQTEQESKSGSELAKANYSISIQEVSAKKDAEIQELKAKINAQEDAKKHAISEAVSASDKEREKVINDLERAKLEKKVSEVALKDKYETRVKDRSRFIRSRA